MKLIVGLGNPGSKYEHTRHNIGFRVMDVLAAELNLQFQNNKNLGAEIAVSQELIIAKPQTFMNESGKSVAAIKKYYKLNNLDILIVHDEIDLPFGEIRLSKDSGSAGHNGIESIIEQLGKDLFRVRIGIENRKQNRIPPTEDYVLKNFEPEEEAELEKINKYVVSEVKKIFSL